MDPVGAEEVIMAEISGKSAPGAAALRDKFGIDEAAAHRH